MTASDKMRKLGNTLVHVTGTIQNVVEGVKVDIELVKWTKIREQERKAQLQSMKLQQQQAFIHKKKKKLVVDTSAMHDVDPFKVINQYDKVILLQGVIREIDSKRSSIPSEHAKMNMRNLLDANAKDSESKKYEVIQEERIAPYMDDNILEFCCTHEDTILFTCDKGLASHAKAYKIPYILGKSVEEEMQHEIASKPLKENVTLPGIISRGKEKIGIQFSDKTTKILLVYDENGNRKSAIGDIYSIQKGDYLIISKLSGQRRLLVQKYQIKQNKLKNQAVLLEKWYISKEQDINIHKNVPDFVKNSLKIQFNAIKRI